MDQRIANQRITKYQITAEKKQDKASTYPFLVHCKLEVLEHLSLLFFCKICRNRYSL